MKIKTIFSRPRVDKLLNAVREYPLTAVVAGAGYGKTTAAKEYLNKADMPYAWVTLTDGDGEVFWDKLCTAVETRSTKAADKLRVIGLPENAWAISRASKLARENCAHPFAICVDDYQLLPDESPVHALVETLAFENIENLHVLLLSRTQPNIRLATLVSKDMAACIDVDALSFNDKETDGYLSMRGLRLTRDAVDSIHRLSGGWISAIYLLGEGVRSGRQIKNSAIDELFTENLMRSLTDGDQESLCRLSVLEYFNPDIAAFALGTERIRDVITSLVRENAFITCDEYGWYRFHPLLQDYLAKRRPDDEMQKNVCRRAGLWCLENRRKYVWLLPVTLFEQAGCMEEFLSLLNTPDAGRINYRDLSAICRTVAALPAEKCIEYPFPYLQLIFYMLFSGDKQPMLLAGSMLEMMQQYFSTHETEYRNTILGELTVIARVTDFVKYEGEPLYEAARLLNGKPSIILNPADPFTFGLPMQLHSEFMTPGGLDAAVERCQHNAYELVTDGFGRGSEKLIRAEAALLRCRFDEAKRFAKQAALDAAEKDQYFIIASAYSTLMRRALFLGDAEEAAGWIGEIQATISNAARAHGARGFTVSMLRKVLALAECFYNTTMLKKEDIPAGFLDGSHKSDMVAGLGVTNMYIARAMYANGDLAGTERMCDSLSRLPNVCQSARLNGLILTALCREHYYGAGSGAAALLTALKEAEQDGVLLFFAENPDILPLLGRIKRQGGVSERFILKIRQECEAYGAVTPKKIAAVSLSAREREVLRLIASGKSRAEAATLLHVQENTVKAQLSSAYKKLGAKGKTEAICIARASGLL